MVGISPDGKWLTYTIWGGGGSTLFLRDVNASTERQIPVPGGSIDAFMQFSPDGKAIYFVRNHPQQRALASQHILLSVERLRRSIDELLALLRLEESLPAEARPFHEPPRRPHGGRRARQLHGDGVGCRAVVAQ